MSNVECAPRWQAVSVTALALMVAACADVTSPSNTVPIASITPDCWEGCLETDPDSTAPGYFMTSLFTSTTCLSPGYQNDVDQDGMGDLCEEQLALRFAPQLYYYAYDNVSREPHWAARRLNGNTARIMYLLSYRRDEGSSTYVCSLPGAPSSCHGHNGDGEVLALDVRFDSESMHWVLSTARYSAHGPYNTYGSGGGAYPSALFYPEKAGGYPRAYVSEGKHANYASRGECNAGGLFGTDTCVRVNTSARVAASFWLNIGSRAFHNASQDCMQSSDPSFEYYGAGATECYWTDVGYFRGWYPAWVGGEWSTPSYSVILAGLGF
jgi:hypothetical protein